MLFHLLSRLKQRKELQVEIAGSGDNHQNIVTVVATLSGKLLPFQILYKGKTEQCRPLTQSPEGFYIWYTPSHWANGETSICFMKNIILPYISTSQKDLGLGEEHMAVVILEVKWNPSCWRITSSQ